MLLPQVDPADVEQELATLAAPWLLCDWSTRDQIPQGSLPRQQAEVLRQTLLQLSARVHVEKGDIRIIGRLPVGFGVQPPEMSWGLLIAGGRDFLERAWWLVTFPGLLITVTVMAINML